MTGGLNKTTSYLAIAAAASLMIAGVAFVPATARAADLGGDCCADLESRVAELEATTVRKGNKKVSVTLSGAVTSAILFWNDGIENDANVITPDTIGGGFTFAGSGKIGRDITAGFNLNFDARFGDPGDGSGLQPDNVTLDANGDPVGGYQAVGKIAPSEVWVYVDSKSLGRLTMGHRSSAYKSANGASDLGGDSGANAYNGGIIDLAAGIQIRDVGATPGTGFNGSWYNALDNAGGGVDSVRGMSVRYDSPSIGGFTFAASLGHKDNQRNSPLHPFTGADDVYSAAVGYSGTHGGTDVSLSAAVQNATEAANGAAPPLTVTDSRWLIGGSLYNKSSGLFITGEYDGVTLNAATNASSNNWFVKGGWHKNVNGAGETGIYGGFERSHDVAIVGVTGSGYFIGVTQAFDSAASVAYFQFQHLSASENAAALAKLCKGGTGCADESSAVMGLKVSF